jgi:hypothetical protein
VALEQEQQTVTLGSPTSSHEQSHTVCNVK